MTRTRDGMTVTCIVAVTSTGDGPCFATNVPSRVETQGLLAAIKDLMD